MVADLVLVRRSSRTVYQIGNIQSYSPRWQCIILLFAVLREVRGGLTKGESVERIRERTWFDIQPEDRLPYPSNRHTSHEQRWITVIAWARKDAVEYHLMHTGTHNNWDLNGAGLDFFVVVAAACREGQLDVRRCYLWSRLFKLRMCPSYIADASDRKRPLNLYEGDWVLRILDLL